MLSRFTVLAPVTSRLPSSVLICVWSSCVRPSTFNSSGAKAPEMDTLVPEMLTSPAEVRLMSPEVVVVTLTLLAVAPTLAAPGPATLKSPSVVLIVT